MATFNVDKALAAGKTPDQIKAFLQAHPDIQPSKPLNAPQQPPQTMGQAVGTLAGQAANAAMPAPAQAVQVGMQAPQGVQEGLIRGGAMSAGESLAGPPGAGVGAAVGNTAVDLINSPNGRVAAGQVLKSMAMGQPGQAALQGVQGVVSNPQATWDSVKKSLEQGAVAAGTSGLLNAVVPKAKDALLIALKRLRGPALDEARLMAESQVNNFVPTAEAKVQQLARQIVPPIQNQANQLGQKLNEVRSIPVAAQGPQEYMAREAASAKIAPIQQQVQDITEQLRALPQQGAEKATQLEQARATAGQAMKGAENAGGAQFSGSAEFEKMVRDPQEMAGLAEKLSKMGPDEIKAMPTQQVQLYRKLAQESKAGLSDIGNAQLQKGREMLSQELAQRIPEFGAARTQYHSVMDAINNLPNEQGAAKAGLQNALGRTKVLLKNTSDEIDAGLQQVRSEEQRQLMGQKQSALTDLKNQLLDTKQQLQQHKMDLADLRVSARGADMEELAGIKKQSSDIVAEAIKRQQLVNKLKNIGWGTAASITGWKAVNALGRGGQ